MGPIGGNGWDTREEEITNDSSGARRLVCHTQIGQTSMLMWKMSSSSKKIKKNTDSSS